MRTGYWIAVFGSVAALAVFACSSSDSDTVITAKGGGVNKGGTAGTGQGGGAQGGGAQGGGAQGGGAQGGQGQGGGGQGGSTGQCTAEETCESVTQDNSQYACVKEDPSTMTACTNGPFGSGCTGELMCAYIDSLSDSICVTKAMEVPAGATACPNGNECAATEVCLTAGGSNVCITHGCTAPTCPNSQLVLSLIDSNQEVQGCVCATECQP